jgi:hypothetical protein
MRRFGLRNLKKLKETDAAVEKDDFLDFQEGSGLFFRPAPSPDR